MSVCVSVYVVRVIVYVVHESMCFVSVYVVRVVCVMNVFCVYVVHESICFKLVSVYVGYACDDVCCECV